MATGTFTHNSWHTKTLKTRINHKEVLNILNLAYICVIDQAYSVKMAVNWPSSFFVEVHKNAKKERGQHPAILTEQAWSIKDLLSGFIFKLKLQQ